MTFLLSDTIRVSNQHHRLLQWRYFQRSEKVILTDANSPSE